MRRYLAPADRIVTVTVRFPVYRQIGRRPSRVYVDETMQPAVSGPAARRLFDNVFLQVHAEIGDQIEERPGGFLLIGEPAVCHSIQLSVPSALDVTTAFGHADAVLHEDHEMLDKLLAEGLVVEASLARPRPITSRVPDAVLTEDHPLVVTAGPLDRETELPVSPQPDAAAAAPANDDRAATDRQ